MEIIGLPVKNTVRPPVVPVDKEDYRDLEKVIESTFQKYPKSQKSVLS
jgi:5-dehydro-4-deoxyglucarate dehydratase